MANGWEITLRRYKASSAVPKRVASKGGTVGDFLAELKEKSDAKPKTLEDYAVALRKIVADVMGQGHGRGGANKRTAWRPAVEGIELADLTEQRFNSGSSTLWPSPTGALFFPMIYSVRIPEIGSKFMAATSCRRFARTRWLSWWEWWNDWDSTTLVLVYLHLGGIITS
jgi:hypothetical protein